MVAQHQPALRPWIALGDADHARHDLEVAGDLLPEEVKAILASPNIRAGTAHGEDPGRAVEFRAAREPGRADVAEGPRRIGELRRRCALAGRSGGGADLLAHRVDALRELAAELQARAGGIDHLQRGALLVGGDCHLHGLGCLAVVREIAEVVVGEFCVLLHPLGAAGGLGAVELAQHRARVVEGPELPVLERIDEQRERLVIGAVEPLRRARRDGALVHGALGGFQEEARERLRAGLGRVECALAEPAECRAGLHGLAGGKFREALVEERPVQHGLRHLLRAQPLESLRGTRGVAGDEHPARGLVGLVVFRLRIGADDRRGGRRRLLATHLPAQQEEAGGGEHDDPEHRDHDPAHRFLRALVFEHDALLFRGFAAGLAQLLLRVFEVLDHFVEALVALVRVLAQRLIDDECGRPRDPRRVSLEAHRLGLEMLERDHRGVLRLEWRTPRQRVEERAAERIHVAAEVLRFVVELLGRDVVGRAPDFTARALFILHEDRQAEVHDLRGVRVGEEDVAGLHVAVNQPVLLRGAQPLRDLDAHVQHLRLRHAALERDEAVERAAVHQLHGDVEAPAIRAGGEDLHYMRMIDRRRDAGLRLELRDELLVLALVAAQELQRHVAVEARVVRPIHHAHAAAAHHIHQLEVADRRPHFMERAARRAADFGERLLVRHVEHRAADRAALEEGFG